MGRIKKSKWNGESYTRLHGVWNRMKTRVKPEFHKAYRYYDRGITVCDEWISDYFAFRDWALENGYSDDLTLDRIDNSKGYSPDNCRFVTYTVNNQNRDYGVNAEDIPIIRRMIEDGVSDSKIGKQFNCASATIWYIRKGKTWQNIP